MGSNPAWGIMSKEEEQAAESTMFINDPANYRNMAEPFASLDEANESIKRFYESVRELRNKFGIRDVLVVIASCAMSKGREQEFMLSGMNGSELNEESMAAYAFGVAQSRRQSRIAEMLSQESTIERLPRKK